MTRLLTTSSLALFLASCCILWVCPISGARAQESTSISTCCGTFTKPPASTTEAILGLHVDLVSTPRGGANAEGQPSSASILEKHPFASAVAITTCNAVAADLITQLVLESNAKKQWKPERTALFAAFGFLFQGCAQYLVVNMIWERLCPGTSRKAVLAKMVGMNFISDPLCFFPVFYIFKESMTRGEMAVRAALEQYSQHYLQDWRNSWLVWVPGHAVTYGVMPPHKRIPWMAFLSFFYMCILSLTRGGGASDIVAPAPDL